VPQPLHAAARSLNDAASVPLTLRVLQHGRWRPVAVATLHGHRGADSFRPAGRWHGQLVPVRRVEIVVALRTNNRWTSHRAFQLTVRLAYTTKMLIEAKAALGGWVAR
jgi:hypothetical protein